MLARRQSLEAATFDLSSGRLWDTAVLGTLTVRTAWALGRAVHSAGLAGPPPWPRGRIRDARVHFDTPASKYLFTRMIRCPLLVAYVIQDHATGQGIDADD